MQKLTKQQQRVLNFMVQSTKKNGYQPTVREIQHHIKASSPNGAYCHLRALVRKGWIKQNIGSRAWGISQYLK